MRTCTLCTAGTLFGVLTLGVTGCGYTDSGSGTDTLEVLAEAVYSPVPNDTTTVDIRVHKGNQPARDARVTLVDGDHDDREFVISEQAEGRYQSGVPGFYRRLALSVRSGNDYLDAKLEGPGRHVITKPLNGQSISRGSVGSSFEAEWDTDDGIRAKRVELRLERANRSTTLLEDTGHGAIAASDMVSGPEELSVSRVNEVQLAGGVGGSYFILSYRVAIEFQLRD